MMKKHKSVDLAVNLLIILLPNRSSGAARVSVFHIIASTVSTINLPPLPAPLSPPADRLVSVYRAAAH